MTLTFSRLRHEINIFSDTLSTPSPAMVSKTLISFFTAFTLAEVLIVLGIIGLIADMTIPTLHQNIKEKVAVSKLKKFYSTIESAYRMAVSENGTPENWGLSNDITNPVGGIILLEKFQPYLNIIKMCQQNENGCWNKNNRWPEVDSYSSAMLADGTNFAIYGFSGIGPRFGYITVNFSGSTKAGKGGIDLFYFVITKNGIIPMGTYQTTTYSFENHCKNFNKTNDTNIGCTAWVLYNENMDYLHCNNLSWDGKKKCD